MARRRRSGRSGKKRRRKNGFIYYYLKVLKKMPNCHVTKVAQIAGCKWRQMSPKERCKYEKAAKKQKRR